jgi:putative two-component system response regulator
MTITIPADLLNASILIVDDMEYNVQLVERMLRSAGYTRIASTTEPKTVCGMHRQNRYDLILLDIQMPGMDGFGVMEGLREIEEGGYLPVIVITAVPDHNLRALQAGAKDFITKPFDLAEVLARVRNMLEVRLLQKELNSYNSLLEQRVRERTADLQDSYQETIFAMTRAAEFRDENTGSHVQRISYYCRELAERLGLEPDFRNEIFFASPMHDIGKLGIPDRILLKTERLTPDEWEVMKVHSALGAKILGQGKSPYLQMGAEIALNHHEHWNGGGYPAGLAGEAIPLSARIVTLCDVYDSLRSKRPYKPAFDHAKTVAIIMQGDGRTQPEYFDPAILEAFRKYHQSYADIFHAYAE